MGAQELTLGAGGNKVGSPPETCGDKIADFFLVDLKSVFRIGLGNIIFI